MRIHAKLTRDEQEIGDVHISVITPADPGPGDVCEAGWIANLEGRPARYSNDLGLIRFRFDDGEWAAVVKVIDKAGYGATA